MMMMVISDRSPSRVWRNEMLTPDIERTCGFIEDRQVRVLYERPRNDKSLLLSAAEMAPLFADSVLVALRKPQHILVQVCEPRRVLDHLLGDVLAEEADVVADRACDEMRALRHEGDLPGPLISHQVANIAAVREHSPRRRGSESQDELYQCGLAASGGPDHPNDFSRTDTCGHIASDGRHAVVRERDSIDLEYIDGADWHFPTRLFRVFQPIEFRQHCAEKGPRRRHVRTGVLDQLSIAQRPEHDQRDASNCGEVEVRRSGRYRKCAKDCGVREADVDDGDESSQYRQSPSTAGRQLDQSTYPRDTVESTSNVRISRPSAPNSVRDVAKFMPVSAVDRACRLTADRIGRSRTASTATAPTTTIVATGSTVTEIASIASRLKVAPTAFAALPTTAVPFVTKVVKISSNLPWRSPCRALHADRMYAFANGGGTRPSLTLRVAPIAMLHQVRRPPGREPGRTR